MFLCAPEQPEKMTTWFFDTAAVRANSQIGFFKTSEPYIFLMTERLVAERGPNGKYCIRKDVFEGNSQEVRAQNLFSLSAKFRDRMNDYSEYTLSYIDALELMKAYEADHREQGHRHRYPGDEVKARMVSKLPNIYRNTPYDSISLPGNHNAL